jgi:hypothetical protein
MPRTAVTAVGAILTPKHGERQVRHQIKQRPDGTFYTSIYRVIRPAANDE